MTHANEASQLRIFRRHAEVFCLLDHESGPGILTVLIAGTAFLLALLLMEGRALRSDGTGITLLAWITAAAVIAGLLVALDEAAAEFLARPVGRDVARAAASLEMARRMLARLGPAPVLGDAELGSMARRIDRTRTQLDRRLAEAHAALGACGALSDPGSRTRWLWSVRREGQAIVAAAEALDGAIHALRWLEACPWSPIRPDAMVRLREDIATGERLSRGTF